MNSVWTDAEKNYIRANASTIKDKDLAEKLAEITGRKVTVQAVRKQRQKMGIVKSQGRGICSLKDKNTGTTSDSIARGMTQSTKT